MPREPPIAGEITQKPSGPITIKHEHLPLAVAEAVKLLPRYNRQEVGEGTVMIKSIKLLGKRLLFVHKALTPQHQSAVRAVVKAIEAHGLVHEKHKEKYNLPLGDEMGAAHYTFTLGVDQKRNLKLDAVTK